MAAVRRRRGARAAKANQPQWYKDAIVYQVHVRAFQDSNDDGVGDFRGLARRLDYVRDLGATAIWLLPFYPSPLRDDGYDIADYTSVHPAYGTLSDFRHFLREAHRRGLKVITELVINHTSDQHPWFQRARRAAPGSAHRDFYVWSDTAERYRDARIIFKDFEASNWTWDATAGAHFWHRFYSHQPDLNFDNPAVFDALLRVMDFWLDMGVDGMRLDAVPYLVEREGTSCENLPETHDVLRRLRRHVDAKYGDRMLLAEANQWPEDAVAYFGEGDECHMAFHFPLMPRMFMALRMEDRHPIIDILDQTPAIPETAQWAIFLRNHDELTLEMVTDEERDYMYRTYAHDPQARINLGIRRRLAPLLENDRRRIELLNGLLFSLPGTPVVYYGDELGMGDNIYLGDRNGVRTPMQWSPDRNAGFSQANPQRLVLPPVSDPDYAYEAVNVESQHRNVSSLLWWMRKLIAQRRGFRALGRGSIEFLAPANRKVLAFLRRFGEEEILVVANLSRHAQYVELDLARFRGRVPVELSGRTEFPPIGEWTYLLTLGPYAFHWLSLERREETETGEAGPAGALESLPRLEAAGGWEDAVVGSSRDAFERVLVRYLKSRGWLGGRATMARSARVADTVRVALEAGRALMVFAEVEYGTGDAETHLVPLVWSAPGDGAASDPADRIAWLSVDGEEGLLCNALRQESFGQALLRAVERRARLRGGAGRLVCRRTRAFVSARGDEKQLSCVPVAGGYSNTALRLGERLVLKLLRRIEEGPNPELEIGSHLTERARFAHAAPVAGAIEYHEHDGARSTVAVLLANVPSDGDAWQYTLDSLERYLDLALAGLGEGRAAPVPDVPLLTLSEGEVSELARESVGLYLETARLLGQRTAEMHLAMIDRTDEEAFALEAFTPFYQRSLFQSMRNLTQQTFDALQQRVRGLPVDSRADAERLAALRPALLSHFSGLLEERITARRTRHHGDYHLRQVLWTGRDFVIIDFEGDAAQPLSSRRIKRSPLRDVAGMLRSFEHAAQAALQARTKGTGPLGEPRGVDGWADYWTAWSSSAFLRAYLHTAAGAPFLPRKRAELERLLDLFVLEGAVQELARELDEASGGLGLAVRNLLRLVEGRLTTS